MNIPEIHPAVDAGSILARRDARAAEKLRCKKANRALRLRSIIACSVSVACLVFALFDLMAWALAFPITLIACVWLSVWVGAWLQFRFAEGGLLDA